MTRELNPDLVEERVPMASGGGVVVRCKRCGGSWWADEEADAPPMHNAGCAHYTPPAPWRTPPRKRVKAGAK